MSIKDLSDKGDTIIEVLICMAIVSFSLGISYGIASRSLAQVRVSEERGQELRLAQQQLERIKQYISDNPDLALNPAGMPGSFYHAGLAGQCIILQPNLTIDQPALPNAFDKCALDQNGSFNDEQSLPLIGSAIDTKYPFRAGLQFDATNKLIYVFAGRFSASGGSGGNSNNFDVVTLIYRTN